MNKPTPGNDEFVDRFMQRQAAERYRDRYRSGRHAKVNQRERACLHQLVAGLGPLEVSLDLPCGTGRLADILAKASRKVILADSSPLMLELAKEELGETPAEYLQTNAERIDLPTGSVDLILCHRLLSHIPAAEVRARIMKELARVTRRYLVISCYPPGIRTRIKGLLRRVFPGSRSAKQPATLKEYLDLANAVGLRLVGRHTLRPAPFRADFVVFEKANAK
jgi:ubiquinone/menaquinone biosynthesis C-methylase UbiE